MKKCCYTLILKNNKGENVLLLEDRKIKVAKRFIDFVLNEDVLRTEIDNRDSLEILINILQRNPNWGKALIRNSFNRRD
jgi:hypothetical protein